MTPDDKPLLNDLFTDSAMEYSTLSSSKEKTFAKIHFTAENFDKFWNDLAKTLTQARISERELVMEEMQSDPLDKNGRFDTYSDESLEARESLKQELREKSLKRLEELKNAN